MTPQFFETNVLKCRYACCGRRTMQILFCHPAPLHAVSVISQYKADKINEVSPLGSLHNHIRHSAAQFQIRLYDLAIESGITLRNSRAEGGCQRVSTAYQVSFACTHVLSPRHRIPSECDSDLGDLKVGSIHFQTDRQRHILSFVQPSSSILPTT